MKNLDGGCFLSSKHWHGEGTSKGIAVSALKMLPVKDCTFSPPERHLYKVKRAVNRLTTWIALIVFTQSWKYYILRNQYCACHEQHIWKGWWVMSIEIESMERARVNRLIWFPVSSLQSLRYFDFNVILTRLVICIVAVLFSGYIYTWLKHENRIYMVLKYRNYIVLRLSKTQTIHGRNRTS